jgi:hypothetical protein
MVIYGAKHRAGHLGETGLPRPSVFCDSRCWYCVLRTARLLVCGDSSARVELSDGCLLCSDKVLFRIVEHIVRVGTRFVLSSQGLRVSGEFMGVSGQYMV